MRSTPLALLAPLVPLLGSAHLDAQGLHPRPGAQALLSWQIVPSPNGGTQPVGNTLLAVDALSPTDVWAVGAQPNPTQYLPAPLAMRWDGHRWTIVPTPPLATTKAQLNSVDAVSSTDVWAVGSSLDTSCGLCDRTLIEHWDGASWRIVPSPNPGMANILEGVAAASAKDVWAVGYQWISWSDWIPLLLHYDGTSWSAIDQSHLPRGRLASVFARSRDDVWAVGWIGTIPNIEGLVLRWNGTSWQRLPFPTEPYGWTLLRGVSVIAADDAWAVGCVQDYNQWGHVESRARSYHWDGSSWTAVLPGVYGRDSRVSDVWARATDDVWAVGAGQTGLDQTFRYVTLHWDGVSWSNVDNQNQGVLNAVSGSSNADVWAVGFGFVTPGTHTLHYGTR
jgi:hypothetical protein